MATFFDSKEEVLDFELTSYGKLLLSKGMLKPSYYSFHDETVLYDKQYAGIADSTQNNIEPRIQEETPMLKVLANDFSIETARKEKLNIEEKKLYSKLFSLSTAPTQIQNAPSWNVVALKNNLLSASYTTTSTTGQHFNIPQLFFSCSYKEEIRLDKQYLQAVKDYGLNAFNDDTITFELSPLGPLSLDGISTTTLEQKSEVDKKYNTYITSKHFQDGTIYTIEEDEIIIDLTQENVGIEEEYEIEVFKYEVDKDGNEIVVPLDFIMKENELIVDDLLVDVEEQFKLLNFDKNKVEYYFNLTTDEQIEQKLICNIIQPLTKNKGINNNLKCKNADGRISTDGLYNNNLVGGSSISGDGQGGIVVGIDGTGTRANKNQSNNGTQNGVVDPSKTDGIVIC